MFVFENVGALRWLRKMSFESIKFNYIQVINKMNKLCGVFLKRSILFCTFSQPTILSETFF